MIRSTKLNVLAMGFFCAAVLLTAASAQATVYSSAVLANNPLGYWRLDETSGTVAVNQGSLGAAFNGVYTNGVAQGVSGATADGNLAASFDGSNDYVLLPGIWGGTTAGTIEAWVNVNDPANSVFRAIVSSTSANYAHIQLYSPGGVGQTGFYGGTFPLAPGLTPINEWHHVAVTTNNTATTVYIDGAVYSSGAGLISTITLSGATEVAIGRGFGGGRLFSGGIDEVAIYDVALTQAQIQAHILAASTAEPVPAPEPSSLLLLGCGVLGLCQVRRRAGRMCA